MYQGLLPEGIYIKLSSKYLAWGKGHGVSSIFILNSFRPIPSNLLFHRVTADDELHSFFNPRVPLCSTRGY